MEKTQVRTTDESFTPIVKLLLVEDEAINRIILTEILFQSGVEVRSVTRGEEVMPALEKEGFDIILMDVRMPGIDGYEATRMIRRWEKDDPQRKPLPIIAMTGYTWEEEWENCRRAGMDDFLSKPVNIEALGRIMQKWVHKDNLPESALPPSDPNDECFEIYGIDVPMGLKQINGNKSLFFDLIRDFLVEYRGTAEKLRDLSSEGRHGEIRDFLHRCKGVAGNLAVSGLYRLCGEMESKAQPDMDPAGFSALIDDFEKELGLIDEAFKSFPAFEPESSGKHDAIVSEPEKILEELEILSGMISEQNVEVLNRVNIFGRMIAGLKDEILDKAAEELADALYRFDFASARRVVRQIRDADILKKGRG